MQGETCTDMSLLLSGLKASYKLRNEIIWDTS